MSPGDADRLFGTRLGARGRAAHEVESRRPGEASQAERDEPPAAETRARLDTRMLVIGCSRLAHVRMVPSELPVAPGNVPHMAKPVSLTPAGLAKRRRAASGLGGIGGGPEHVVGHLGMMQAQDWLGARWAIGVRQPSTGAGEVLSALDERRFVRGYPARTTVHWVRPGDLRWMLVATAERMSRSGAGQRSARGLTDARLDAAESIAREALSGTALGRAEFAKALAAGGIDPAEVYHYIVWLAVRGVVVWGPAAPPQQALVLLDEWAPATEPLPDRAESIRRWTVCYLRGHGPATAEDVAWWTGLTLGDARLGIEAARDDLVEYDVQGEPMWALAAEHPPAPPVSLLPPFDESVLSYRDRSRHLAEEHIEHVFPGSNGMFAATVVVHGRIAGVWRRTLKPATKQRAASVEVEVRLFAAQPASVLAAVERAAAGYARFLGREMRYQLAPG